MPVAVTNPRLRSDPILGYSFAVLMFDVILGWFTECNGLTLEREVVEQREGGVNHLAHQLPGRVKQTRLTLKHGLAGPELWSWFNEGLFDGNVDRRNISIILYNSILIPHKAWHVIDAYPVKWSGPSFNTSGKDVSIETVELVHHGLMMVDLSLAGMAAAAIA